MAPQNSLAADLGCTSSNTPLARLRHLQRELLRSSWRPPLSTFNASMTTRPCPARSTSADDEPPSAAVAAAPFSPRGAWIAVLRDRGLVRAVRPVGALAPEAGASRARVGFLIRAIGSLVAFARADRLRVVEPPPVLRRRTRDRDLGPREAPHHPERPSLGVDIPQLTHVLVPPRDEGLGVDGGRCAGMEASRARARVVLLASPPRSGSRRRTPPCAGARPRRRRWTRAHGRGGARRGAPRVGVASLGLRRVREGAPALVVDALALGKDVQNAPVAPSALEPAHTSNPRARAARMSASDAPLSSRAVISALCSTEPLVFQRALLDAVARIAAYASPSSPASPSPPPPPARAGGLDQGADGDVRDDVVLGLLALAVLHRRQARGGVFTFSSSILT